MFIRSFLLFVFMSFSFASHGKTLIEVQGFFKRMNKSEVVFQSNLNELFLDRSRLSKGQLKKIRASAGQKEVVISVPPKAVLRLKKVKPSASLLKRMNVHRQNKSKKLLSQGK